MGKKIEIARVNIPEKGRRQLQPTVKEAIVDEWRALGFSVVRIYREGLRVVIEPVE